MQQRLRRGSAKFNFDALLGGVSTLDPSGQTRDGSPPGLKAPPATAPQGRGRMDSRTRGRVLMACGAIAVVTVLVGMQWLGTGKSGTGQALSATAAAATRPGKSRMHPSPQTSGGTAHGGSVVHASVPTAPFPRGTMPLQLSHELAGPFSYWFVTASQKASSPHRLPTPDTHGRVVLKIPTAYNDAGVQLRILDQSLGKVAHLPVMDFGRPDVVIQPQLGTNLLKNAVFENTADGWKLEQAGATAHGSMQVLDGLDGPAGVSGRVVRFEVTALDAQNWHVQFSQPGLDLQEGKEYQLAFWAKSDRERRITLCATLDQPDWHTLGFSPSVLLTTEWKKYALRFTARHTLPEHGRLSIVLGDALGAVELKGISMRRVTGETVSHPLNHNSVVELARTDFH
jgi:hypothetical protein